MASSRALLGVILVAALAPVSANDLGGVDCDSLRGGTINPAVDWEADIKPLINESYPEGRCTSCHGGQSGSSLDLTDDGVDAITKIFAAGIVVPGKPQASVLFDKINCNDPGHGGQRMPYLQNPYTLAQQALFYDWIAQGALGDDPEEPANPRDFIFRDGGETQRWY